jgi:hypothetical protein
MRKTGAEREEMKETIRKKTMRKFSIESLSFSACDISYHVFLFLLLYPIHLKACRDKSKDGFKVLLKISLPRVKDGD